jgi:hypothetical protein
VSILTKINKDMNILLSLQIGFVTKWAYEKSFNYCILELQIRDYEPPSGSKCEMNPKRPVNRESIGKGGVIQDDVASETNPKVSHYSLSFFPKIRILAKFYFLLFFF